MTVRSAAWMILAALLPLAARGEVEAPQPQAAVQPPSTPPPDLSVPPPGLPPPAPPRGGVLPVPDLRPRIYVKDLDHLADLVKEDPAVAAKARDLASRRTAAFAIGGGLLATGLAVTLTGLGKQTCEQQSIGFPGSGTLSVCQPDPTQVIVGSVIQLAGVLTAAILAPKRGDLLDVLNAWNGAHPDRPFYLGHEPLQQVAEPAPEMP